MFRKLGLFTMTCLFLCELIVAILAVLSTTPAMAQANVPSGQVTLLLIHGRRDPRTCPSKKQEEYGTLDTDQCGLWDGLAPSTFATRKYVQWDAWFQHIDSATRYGGRYEILAALTKYCRADNNNSCYIICHSAGCAALESCIATCGAVGEKLHIVNVLAAGSAAGGSEVADNFYGWPEITGWVAPIDRSLRTSYLRRKAYDHNHMKGITVRGIAGTSIDTSIRAKLSESFFPHKDIALEGPNKVTNYNHDCSKGGLVGPDSTYEFRCADSDVSLHSTCGHRIKAFFWDCNTMIRDAGNPPGSISQDTKGTFDFHGWWVNDHGFYGPYSPEGKANPGGENGIYHTYDQDHGGSRNMAVYEYSWCYAAQNGLCY